MITLAEIDDMKNTKCFLCGHYGREHDFESRSNRKCLHFACGCQHYQKNLWGRKDVKQEHPTYTNSPCDIPVLRTKEPNK